MSVLSEIISAEGSSPVSGTEEMPCEWKSAWFLTATESWHYSFKKYLLSIYCALEWWKERQDSSGACPHEGYNRKKRKRLFSIAFYVPAPRVKRLLIREGIERITLWICHDVVPLCNKSSSARGYGFLVSTPPFVVMPCLFFTSFQVKLLWKRANHIYTPVPQMCSSHLPAFCSLKHLGSIWEHRSD